MPIAEITQTLQELRRRSQNAALTLYRFNHDSAGMVIHHRVHRMEIVKRNMDDIRRFWPEAIGILWLSPHGNGKQRAAVERIMKGNDFGFEWAMTHTGIMTRQLERRFVSFCPGVHEQHALGKGGIDNFSPQTQCGFVGENVTGMPERFALGFQGLYQCRMTMPQRSHRNPAREINIVLALLIPDPAAFPFYRNKLRRCINRQNDFIESCPGYCLLFSCHLMTIQLCQNECENIITKYA